MKILVIEDNQTVLETIRLVFQIRWPGAQMVTTGEGEKGIRMAESEKPDIIILDLGLPDISGFDVLKQVRLFSDVPILILTARSEEADIVKGLEWGADDFVTKPFRQLELLSRIQAITRRRGGEQKETPIALGSLSLNPTTGELTDDGKPVKITLTEARVLYQLMKNAGQVVTHATLAEALWGSDYPGSADSLKVYISRLREKLEKDTPEPKLILTRPGVGYQIVKP